MHHKTGTKQLDESEIRTRSLSLETAIKATGSHDYKCLRQTITVLEGGIVLIAHKHSSPQ